MKTSHKPAFAVYERGERVRDAVMVSTFALWAMVLGFTPVVTYRLLGMLVS